MGEMGESSSRAVKRPREIDADDVVGSEAAEVLRKIEANFHYLI